MYLRPRKFLSTDTRVTGKTELRDKLPSIADCSGWPNIDKLSIIDRIGLSNQIIERIGDRYAKNWIDWIGMATQI